jgi:serine/threonine protein kinase
LPTPIHNESPTDKHYSAFQNEVHKLKKVNENPNPNVVKILSSGITETGSLPFIEMEFIEGPDLEELLQPPHDPVFTIKETIKLAEQLSNALAHCHKLDIKHGDIKSNNVKFNGHSGNYVLLDFGLAVMSDEQRRTSLRHAGAIEFMAPEQSEGQMLFQTDVYSFGIIVFELLAGEVPFPVKDKGESARNNVMLAHMESPPPDVFELRRKHIPAEWSAEKKQYESRIPEWLVNMVYRCLEKRPENRFKSGVELHDYIIRNSIINPDRNESNSEQVLLLQQENKKLLREKQQLEKLLAQYQPKEPQASPAWEERPRKKSSNSILPAAILTAVVIALIVYFVLHKNETGTPPDTGTTTQTETPKTVVGQYRVLAARAYFHDQPDPATRRSAYMVPSNDTVDAMDDRNGFIYTEFTNSRGSTSKGWLRKQDLVTLAQWAANNPPHTTARPNNYDINDQLKEAREMLAGNRIGEALNVYSYLSDQGVPEAMYQYANLALQNKNDALDCAAAILLMDSAAQKGYAPAQRTLGFLDIFAENKDVLGAANYGHCSYEKNIFKGTQLLIQAIRGGDSTAKSIMDDINLRREQGEQQ